MPDSPDSPGHPHDDPDTSQGPPAGIDPAVPSPARMYNYFLGGRDNFPADRLAAEKALSVVPDGRRIALANRYFLAQATLRMADRGITQFLDLGTGIPTSPAVHEVAREITPMPASPTWTTTRWSSPTTRPSSRRSKPSA